jgi:hypothetical protein
MEPAHAEAKGQPYMYLLTVTHDGVAVFRRRRMAAHTIVVLQQVNTPVSVRLCIDFFVTLAASVSFAGLWRVARVQPKFESFFVGVICQRLHTIAEFDWIWDNRAIRVAPELILQRAVADARLLGAATVIVCDTAAARPAVCQPQLYKKREQIESRHNSPSMETYSKPASLRPSVTKASIVWRISVSFTSHAHAFLRRRGRSLTTHTHLPVQMIHMHRTAARRSTRAPAAASQRHTKS